MDPADDVVLDGASRSIDGVNVWPMLTGAATTRPEGGRFIATTEASIIDTETGFKLVTLAGPSRYYLPNQTAVDPSVPGARGHLPCLEKHQHPSWLPKASHTASHDFINQLCNGAGLDPAHLEKYEKSCACAVCNATQPCLFQLHSDPQETANVASAYPAVVSALQQLLEKAQPYVDGEMDAAELAESYEQIADPDAHWRNFSGPCYVRKAAVPGRGGE